MFGNISSKECISIIVDILVKKNRNPVKQNYFTFNKKIYRQTSGLSMGSPLSPLLAEVFMSNFEETILSSNQAKQQLKFWYRYVDDVLICFDGTSRQLNAFLELTNSWNPKIQFTLETETNNNINFLDLSIKRTPTKLEFNIYRKPTYSDITIPADSLHPWCHKAAAYHSLINRALKIPLSEDNLQTELKTIQKIAVNNGFDKKWILRMVRKKKYQMLLSTVYKEHYNLVENYKSITYFGESSERIGKILKKQGINVAYKPPVRLGDLILNHKDKLEKKKKSGVYRLRCGECAGVYIGQTGRSFETRRSEHLRSFRLKKTDSSFANHLLETGHQPNKDMEVLHIISKGQKLNCWEALEIHKTKKSSDIILNDQTETFFSSLFNISTVNNISNQYI